MRPFNISKLTDELDDISDSSQRLDRYGRIALVFLLTGFILAIGIACRLEPDTKGWGTHRQLGLDSCFFREQTGQPCPTCGMTTSAAWLVRGQFGRAWLANPAMCFLGFLSSLVAIWVVASLIRDQLVGFSGWDRVMTVWALGLSSIAVMSWSIRFIQWQLLIGQGP